MLSSVCGSVPLSVSWIVSACLCVLYSVCGCGCVSIVGEPESVCRGVFFVDKFQ